MEGKMKRFIFVLGILLILISAIFCIFIKFKNPDMTETRLFITYWPQILFFSFIAFIGALFILKSY